MPSVPVTVPSVGESISEGILSRWHKADGSLVRAGEPLFELETDKATSDIPAGGTGVLRIAVKEGETVAVGATVATIDPADSASTAAPAEKQPQPRSCSGSSDASPARSRTCKRSRRQATAFAGRPPPRQRRKSRCLPGPAHRQGRPGHQGRRPGLPPVASHPGHASLRDPDHTPRARRKAPRGCAFRSPP